MNIKLDDFTTDLLKTKNNIEFSSILSFIIEYFEELSDVNTSINERLEFIERLIAATNTTTSKELIESEFYRIVGHDYALPYLLRLPLEEPFLLLSEMLQNNDISSSTLIEGKTNFINIFNEVLNTVCDLSSEFQHCDNLKSFTSIANINNKMKELNLDTVLGNINKFTSSKTINSYSNKITIIKFDLLHENFNSIYLPYFNAIISSKSREKNYEYVLIHELGHYAHLRLSGSLDKLPKGFKFLSGLEVDIDSAKEVIADLFSIKIMENTKLENKNPFLVKMKKDLPLKEIMMRDAEYFSFFKN